jgi:Carboxylesterase family
MHHHSLSQQHSDELKFSTNTRRAGIDRAKTTYVQVRRSDTFATLHIHGFVAFQSMTLREHAGCKLSAWQLFPSRPAVKQQVHSIVGVGEGLVTRDASEFIACPPPAVKHSHQRLGEAKCRARPKAKGLFQRAIIESGAYQLQLPSLATAEAQGDEFATVAGCPNQTATCLRSLSVEQILAHENVAGYVTNIDGKFLTQSIGTALATGALNHMPVINGTNHDEGRLFVAPGRRTAAPLTLSRER